MKSERRHELETNELADRLGGWAESIRPYSTLISIGVVALLLGLVVFALLGQQARTRQAGDWEAFFAATEGEAPNKERLQALAEQAGEATVGLWARIALADYQLNEGIEQMFNDRAKARAELQHAIEHYRFVQEVAGRGEPGLLERAALGLGRAHETLGDLESAREQYSQLIEFAPDSPFAEVARERLEDLNNERTQRFYDWFVSEEPKPRPDGSPATGDRLPFEFESLPDAPGSAGVPSVQTPQSFLQPDTPTAAPGETGPGLLPPTGVAQPDEVAAPDATAPAEPAPGTEPAEPQAAEGKEPSAGETPSPSQPAEESAVREVPVEPAEVPPTAAGDGQAGETAAADNGAPAENSQEPAPAGEEQ